MAYAAGAGADVSGAGTVADPGRKPGWTTELAQTGDAVVSTVLRLLRVRRAALYHLDRASRQLVCVAAAGEGDAGKWIGEVVPANTGLAGRVVAERRPISSSDLLADPEITLPAWGLERILEEGYRSGIAVPLISHDEALGALFLGDAAGRQFTQDELGLLAVFADHAAMALENASLHAAALARVRELAGLVEVNRVVTGTLNFRAVAQAILEAAQILLPNCAGQFWELLPGKDELELIETRGFSDSSASPEPRRRPGDGLARAVVSARAPIAITDLSGDSRLAREDWVAAEGFVSLVALPLLHAGNLYGTLELFTRTRHEFGREEVGLLESFAAQAAAAVANSRLHSETVQRRREAEVLAELVRDINASLDLDSVLQRVAETARELCQADQSHIAVADPGGEAMDIRYWAGARSEKWRFRIEPGRGLGGQVLLTGRPFRTDNYAEDPRISHDYIDAARAEEVIANLAVPIRSGDRTVGLLFVSNRSARPFTDSDETILLRLAGHAAIAIRNARLHEETLHRLRETEGLLSVAQTVGNSLDPLEIARRSARQATLLLRADCSIFFTVDDTDPHVTGIAGYRVPEVLRRLGFRVPVAELPPIVKEATQSGRSIASADVPADPRFDHPMFRTMPVQPRSILCAPVLSRGRVRGAILTLWWTEAHRATEDEIRLAQGVAGQTVLALDNARLYEEAQRALTDLRAAQERLVQGETLRALGGLSGGAAHHLNNLLAIVWGRVQLLLQREEAGTRRRSLEVVERAARDAADVVRRLQQFARGEPAHRAERVNLNELASEVLEMTRARWHDLAQAQGVRIDVTFQRGDIPLIHGDPVALREVIVNLVVNAVDALPAGGRITVASRAEGSMVVLEVADTGVGMPEEVRRRALEPFFTTKGVTSTGLGLSVSHGVVQRHAGELSVESADGLGTTVTIRLPAIAASVQTPTPAAAATSVRPLRILVIDDMAEVRELLAATLQSLGHTVAQAAGGREGLARLQSGAAVDLVLTDLGMPEMNGWQVAKIARTRWPRVRVGVITGWGETADATPAERECVDFVMAKPFAADALQRAIDGIVDRLATDEPAGRGA